MHALIQKFLALFSPPGQGITETPEPAPTAGGMPLASAAYMRDFAQRLGLGIDDLSGAEQAELKARLDRSMDFREENYGQIYHEVYRLGHGYSLADANRVSAQINKIIDVPTARAYFEYRENAVAAEALMAAGALLAEAGDTEAAGRLFKLADDRRHRSSVLEFNVAELPATDDVDTAGQVAEEEALSLEGESDAADTGEDENSGLAGLMHTSIAAEKPVNAGKSAK